MAVCNGTQPIAKFLGRSFLAIVMGICDANNTNMHWVWLISAGRLLLICGYYAQGFTPQESPRGLIVSVSLKLPPICWHWLHAYIKKLIWNYNTYSFWIPFKLLSCKKVYLFLKKHSFECLVLEKHSFNRFFSLSLLGQWAGEWTPWGILCGSNQEVSNSSYSLYLLTNPTLSS